MTGSVAIEFGNQCYVAALDNGLFNLGAPHNEGKRTILSFTCSFIFLFYLRRI